ncbi:hypothetical protein DPMN_004828 [Dreissena polymorpha]|uniref:Uncharacterized protein n=1 Tax=Dreissena polymorpha TaxID=45954 RepID=A0A9D4RTB4_DREPO|nr:hypothetical protein DPMN_004828 [Dreissena polymorpha]
MNFRTCSGIRDNYVLEGFENSDQEDEDDNASFTSDNRYYQPQKNLLDGVAPAFFITIIENQEDQFQDTEVICAMNVLVPDNIK